MNPVFLSAVWHGAVTGLVGAAMADYAAFRSWQSFEAAKAYNWKVALWRWFQGALTGALTGAGFGAAGL